MEQVLCIARKDIPAEWLTKMGETALNPEGFYHRLNTVKLHWLDREMAEKSTVFKQVIPYTVFQWVDKDLIGCYQRNGSEKRLADLWSIGIGGHINPEDAVEDGIGLESLVTQGLIREIKEETGKLEPAAPEFVGVINEECTPVGSVHFGLVHRMVVGTPEQLAPSAELSRFHWIETEKAEKLNLEYWSFLALKLLKRHAGHQC
jgi:predicted NUDIX family phosphoesterase